MNNSGWGVLRLSSRPDIPDGWVKENGAVWMGSEEDAKKKAAFKNTQAAQDEKLKATRHIPISFAEAQGKWKAIR